MIQDNPSARPPVGDEHPEWKKSPDERMSEKEVSFLQWLGLLLLVVGAAFVWSGFHISGGIVVVLGMLCFFLIGWHRITTR